MKRGLFSVAVFGALYGCGGGGTEPTHTLTLSKQREVTPGLSVGGADSVSVKVADETGAATAGVSVSFAVVSGGGSLSAATATTGSDGIASVLWTLGTVSGPQLATASSSATSSGTLSFPVNATAGPAAALTKIGSDPVAPPPGTPFDSLRVLLADQFGNPVVGQPVDFAVTAGGGTVFPASVLTGVDGRAASRWTFGTGGNTVNGATATKTGLPPVTFTTTTSVAAAKIVLTTPRIIVVDSGGTANVTFEARDGAGNVLAGQPTTAVNRTPAATYSNGVVTGAHRGQTFIVVSSTLNAAAKDSVLVIVGIPGAPVLLTDQTVTDYSVNQIFTVAIVVDMRASTDKLGSATLQVQWNPSVLTYQSDAEGTSSVGATVNAANVSSGFLALSMASSSGFTGKVQIRQITFKAAAVSGTSGSITLLPTDLTAAATFNNLLLNTVAAAHPLLIK